MKTNKNEKQTRSDVEDQHCDYDELLEYLKGSETEAFREYMEEVTDYQYQIENGKR